MLAYDYPLLGIFWTIFIVFIWVAWIILLFRVFIDIFRSHDMGGWGKGLWCVAIIILPFLGVFIYVIARGRGMAERSMEQAKQDEADFRTYVQDAAGSGGTADELAKLSELHKSGVLSDDEFAQQKAKLLS
jgi:hypothetical protein